MKIEDEFSIIIKFYAAEAPKTLFLMKKKSGNDFNLIHKFFISLHRISWHLIEIFFSRSLIARRSWCECWLPRCVKVVVMCRKCNLFWTKLLVEINLMIFDVHVTVIFKQNEFFLKFNSFLFENYRHKKLIRNLFALRTSIAENENIISGFDWNENRFVTSENWFEVIWTTRIFFQHYQYDNWRFMSSMAILNVRNNIVLKFEKLNLKFRWHSLNEILRIT